MVPMLALALAVFLIVVLVVLTLYLVSVYNTMVRYRVEVDNSWSQIDVQLKRRHDLIPNLVESVKGVMEFEKGTLTQVMQARASAMGASNMGDRLKAENEITRVLGRADGGLGKLPCPQIQRERHGRCSRN